MACLLQARHGSFGLGSFTGRIQAIERNEHSRMFFCHVFQFTNDLCHYTILKLQGLKKRAFFLEALFCYALAVDLDAGAHGAFEYNFFDVFATLATWAGSFNGLQQRLGIGHNLIRVPAHFGNAFMDIATRVHFE